MPGYCSCSVPLPESDSCTYNPQLSLRRYVALSLCRYHNLLRQRPSRVPQVILTQSPVTLLDIKHYEKWSKKLESDASSPSMKTTCIWLNTMMISANNRFNYSSDVILNYSMSLHDPLMWFASRTLPWNNCNVRLMI